MNNIAISVYRSTDNRIAYESHDKRYFKTLSAKVTDLAAARVIARAFIEQLNDACIVGFVLYYTNAKKERCIQLNKLDNTQHIQFMGAREDTPHI